MAITEHPGLRFWAQASEDTRNKARALLATVARTHADALVGQFYSTFLAHDDASSFLSHSVVNERLSSPLRTWLLDLIEVDPLSDLTEFDNRQVFIGQIHARLKIPNNLVMEGMTLLKTQISLEVAALSDDHALTTQTIILLDELIDYAMRLMTAAYVSDTKRRVQTDEAFRLFSLGQDVNLERETQRAALMEWSESVLFGLLGQGGSVSVNPLSSSPFGLWVRHRGAVLFHASPLLASIEALMCEIDSKVLPTVAANAAEAIVALRLRIDEIKYLLSDLFQTAASLENGRDPLTRALNRRFLPTVLGREVSLAAASRTPLSVLMIDIDHFKTINDRYGHSAGDLALSRTAEILLNTVRASDFVFRFGGEEFLIVLVETGLDEAAEIGERLRHDVASNAVPLSDREPLSVTISVGIGSYEGHPDYQYLVDAADKALYAAKHAGRNRVALAHREPAERL